MIGKQVDGLYLVDTGNLPDLLVQKLIVIIQSTLVPVKIDLCPNLYPLIWGYPTTNGGFEDD